MTTVPDLFTNHTAVSAVATWQHSVDTLRTRAVPCTKCHHVEPLDALRRQFGEACEQLRREIDGALHALHGRANLAAEKPEQVAQRDAVRQFVAWLQAKRDRLNVEWQAGVR